ncbi:gliding motility-associated C-terminal domain-containing protein [Adhaeribacter sp. BT258]|uniref:Gliding motility-associated C-terminal domain-containing protein n=1 Tax=Adhaeribacter terrigena TaxID=2793070 RepID=A0ABS1C5B4_9BACT|nr:gliding motility-associated C-terminal domain-containing protein [Adhaeribacter terrigena]MBK0404566.1 gliding motility-associated C-terminal domain-containing protein [Adhaeribacter terrigena]
MRIKNLLKAFFLLLMLFQMREQVQASHLYGGEFTYEYLGPLGSQANPFRYRITLKHYVGSNGANITNPMTFNYYNSNGNNTGTHLFNSPSIQANPNPAVLPNLPLPIPANCPIPFPLIKLLTFVHIVDLPLSFNGYYVTAVANARNSDITNIQGGNMSLYMQIPPPFLENPGSSPVFTDTAVVVIFAGDTTSIINSAFDADGDRLIYSFNQPYAFNANGLTFSTPPQTVTYMPGYSFAQPFGVGGYASINASTGLAKYYVPPIPGNTQDRKYVVSFQVKEYRNIPGVGDIQIGSSIRDIQLVVKDIPPNSNLKPNFTYTGPKIITITEGAAIPPINFTFTDPNAGQTMKITATSPLLDGPGNKNASFNNFTSNATINNAASGTTATFNFTSVCGDANIYPLNITVQDQNICPPLSKVETFQIEVLPYEGPQKIFGDTIVCTSSTKTYNVTGKASANYNWRLAGGGTILGNKNNDSIRVQWTTTGRFKLTAIETSTGSCSDSISFFVNVTPGIALTLNASATAICAGTPVTLTAAGGTSYTWSDGTNTFAGSTLTVTPAATTTYSVSGTGITGCNGANSITITVNPPPTVDAGTNRSICQGSPVTLTATGASAYSWTDGISTFTGNNINVTPATTTTYTVTGTNSVSGCFNTDQVTITVVPGPVVDAGVNQAVCAGTPVTLNATGAATYSWTDGTNTFTGSSLTVSPAGTTTYTVTGTTNSCTSTDQVTVTVSPLPVLTVANRVICAGQATTLTASSLGISSFTFTDGTNTFTGNNISVSPAATTTYSVTGTTASNCSATTQLTVMVNPLPVVNAGADRAICLGTSTTLTATANATATYSWTDGTNTFTGNNLSVSPLATTTYTVTATNTATGCISTDQVTITVNPNPIANAGLNQTVCSNEPATIGAPAVAGFTYSWTGTGLSANNIANPVVTLPNTTTAPITQTYIVTATNSFGCIAKDTVLVTIKPLPVANAGADKTLCSATSTTLGSAATTGYTYSWAPATGLSSASVANPAISLTNNTTAPISQIYTVTTTLNGCVTSDQVTVTVNPAITVDAGANQVICSGNTATVGTAALPGYTYSWTPHAGLSSLTTAMPVFTGTNTSANPITVRLYVTATANNCSKADSVLVTVNPTPLADAIAGPTSICPGLSGVKYRIINPRQSNYQWALSSGHGTIVSGQGTSEIIVNWNGAAAASVSAQAVNAQGCTGPAFNLPVTINPVLTTPQPVGPTSICKSQANTVRYVMPNPTIGSSFTWTVTGGAVASSNVKGDTVYINWTTVGANNIVVQESSTGSANCFGSSPAFVVTVLPSPDPTLTISGPTAICQNTATNFTLAGAANSTYAWTVTHNGTTSPLNSTTGTVSFQSADPGLHTLTVLELNANGCAGTPITKNVTVEPTPVVTQIFGSANVCPEDLNNQLFYVQGPAGYTYNWQISGGTMVNAGSTNDSIYVNFDNTDTKQIKVTPVSALGCVGAPVTLNVILDASIVKLNNISAGPQNDKVVEMDLQMLRNTTGNNRSIEIYRREAGTTTFSKIQTLPNTALSFTDNGVQTNSKVYEYRLESLNECGTVLNSTMHRTIMLEVKANEAAKTVRLNWNGYQGWNVSGYEIYAQADNGTFELLQTKPLTANDTILTLTNISSRGFNQCFRIKAKSADARVSWSNIACVDFVNELKFYNIITPNNDGYNDKFVIENINLYPDNELSIFNRWGSEVYRKKAYDNSWTGKDQAPGTYYFLLKLKDGRSFKNWVEIAK